jgi:hypothetical protein
LGTKETVKPGNGSRGKIKAKMNRYAGQAVSLTCFDQGILAAADYCDLVAALREKLPQFYHPGFNASPAFCGIHEHNIHTSRLFFKAELL